MPRKSLIRDPIHPTDWQKLDIIYCCEQCSHFAPDTKTCTIGYEAANHLQEAQLKSYELTGRVAFCRFSEID